MYHKAFRCSYGVAIEKMFFKLDWFLKEEIKVPPTLEEQARIAETLSVMDRNLVLLSDRVSVLALQKKGLLQRLLTGRIRVRAKEATYA
jgi:type I restriction enzyme S subunit